MYCARGDIPTPDSENFVQAISKLYEEISGRGCMKSITFTVPDVLYEAIKKFQYAGGTPKILEAISECLQSEAK